MKLLSTLKKILKKEKEKPDFTIGEQKEDGFAPLLKDGKETNVKIMVWTKEEIEKFNKD